MDVVFLHPSRTPRGGIVNATLAHALSLLLRGHRVEVWTASYAVATKASKLGLTVFQNAALSSPARSLLSPRVAAAFLQLRLRGVDAVVHEGGKAMLPALLATNPYRQFVVFHNDKLGGRRPFRNWLCLSKAHAAELEEIARRERLPRTVARIPNGVVDAAETSTIPPAVGPSGLLRVGALAELKRHKGIDILLDAAQRLAADGVDIQLHVGGAGPEQAALRAQAERLGLAERITWHGWVDDPDPFFANFDVFCLPSRREPFGLVVIEAMARGKIVVASRTKGPCDIIDHGRTGYLVKTGDAEALAAGLRAVSTEAGAGWSIAEAGQSHARQAYSLEAVGASLEGAIMAARQRWGRQARAQAKEGRGSKA